MRRAALVALPTAALVLGSGGVAWAVWSATADGPGAASTDALPTAGRPTATVAGGTVTLTLPAAATTGGRAVPRYDLTRYPVGSPTAAATTSCTASPCVVAAVPSGTWEWTSVARYGNSWAGPAGPRSTAVVVDTAAPLVGITTPAQGAAVRPTSSATGTAGTLAGDLPTITLRLYAGTGTTALVATVTTTASGGAWSYTPDPLLAGTYTLTASQADATGNVTTTPGRTFTVDATAPTPTVTAPAVGATTGRTPTVSGTATAGDLATITVLLTGPGGTTRTLTTTANGTSWSVVAAPALTSGTWTASAKQSDAAGNVGTSTNRTFTVDATAPTPVVTGTFTALSGNTSSTVSGTATGGAGNDTTVVVRLYGGRTTAGAVLREVTATVRTNNTWTADLNGRLGSGTDYTFTVQQSDVYGNVGLSAPYTMNRSSTETG